MPNDNIITKDGRHIDTTPPAVVKMVKTDLVTEQGVPRWAIYQVMPDGTEKMLGIQ
jgi:hypothetical protein